MILLLFLSIEGGVSPPYTSNKRRRKSDEESLNQNDVEIDFDSQGNASESGSLFSKPFKNIKDEDDDDNDDGDSNNHSSVV